MRSWSVLVFAVGAGVGQEGAGSPAERRGQKPMGGAGAMAPASLLPQAARRGHHQPQETPGRGPWDPRGPLGSTH